MSEKLSKNDISKIAKYAHIVVDDEFLNELTVDMNNIIETLDTIRTYKLDGVKPTFHPIGNMCNVMRDDKLGTSLPVKEALENAPKSKNDCFEIPSILGAGGAN